MPNENNLILTASAGLLTIEAAQATDDGKPKARRFDMVAYSGDVMRVGGWSDPVVVDLKGMRIVQKNKPIFLGHSHEDIDSLIGQTDNIKIAEGQLVATGQILGNSERVKQVLALHDSGFKWQASIGARAEKQEFLAEGFTAKVNGRDMAGPMTIVRKSTLGEISFVMLGADESTSAAIAAEHNTSFKEPIMATENTVIEAAAVPEVQDIRAKHAAEYERIAAIEKVVGITSDITAKAIKEGWDISRAELEVLRASRPIAPAVKTEQRLDSKIIEAAACLSGKVNEQAVLKAYGEQVINEADKYRRIGIHDLFRLCARAEGRELPSIMGDVNGFIRAAFSTVSLPGILSNIANKMLLEAYNYQESTWRTICKIASVNDFKTHTRYRLTDNMTFQKVGADGELKHAKLGEQTFTNKAETSGIMFSLNRQTIINDDMGAFASIPQFLGIGAADAISDAVWTLLLSNPSSFFSASPTGYKANYMSGSTTPLSIDSLTAAELLFLNQQKPNGRPLGVAAKYLLVPNALLVKAKNLMNSLQLNEAATAGAPQPSNNPHAGKWEVVSSSWLSNALITGYSAVAWYLFADPARLAAIEAAFLNGKDTPTVEQAEADFNTLGIQFRGYIDFGVAMQDPRAAVMSKGSA